MRDTKSFFEAEACYHLYNHANGGDDLFLSNDNYKYFLNRLEHYCTPFCEILSYCLMPNHFHLLIRIRSTEIIFNGEPHSPQSLHRKIIQTLSNFFNAYAKAFNKQQNRRGALFCNGVKRIQITDERHLQQLILYIHNNPVHHNFRNHPSYWPYSSYNTIVQNRRGIIPNQEIIQLFGGKENFIGTHEAQPEPARIKTQEMWNLKRADKTTQQNAAVI
jgi:REP element-mobilizing transposase RayT